MTLFLPSFLFQLFSARLVINERTQTCEGTQSSLKELKYLQDLKSSTETDKCFAGGHRTTSYVAPEAANRLHSSREQKRAAQAAVA